LLPRLLLALAVAASPALAAGERAPEPCRETSAAGASYVVCALDLRRYRLQLFLKDPSGGVYSSFDSLVRSREGEKLVFAMNGGMYHADLSPVGLYVEDGLELQRISTANGPGNFHLKPNGVFYVRGQTAGVLETSRYRALKPRAEFATQSGPMLVIDGRIHPKISEQGVSRKVRNGVCVRNQHTAIFAISNEPVTFGAFAHLFKDELGCANALFLDGSVSSLYAPNLNRADAGRPMGPIIGAKRR
jgi:prepilin-type processing-associated H-X9-DG protein